MSYLKFDKTILINTEKSLTKELLRANRVGAYSSTTLIECNTRKYHGQLIVPCPELTDTNHVLLSSFDETVVQYGAEFNLGTHKYPGDHFSPNGHKYIREFDCDLMPRTIFRVGGVILLREKTLLSFENRIIYKYTLLDAHSPTLLRFKPFLAFRATDRLSKENYDANTGYEEVPQGISTCLYQGYPNLVMQFSKKNSYTHHPNWYHDIEYYKEQERGYDYKEDLLVSGHFELPIKKGESIFFTAGLEPISPRKIKLLWEKELSIRTKRTDMLSCLSASAKEFYYRGENDSLYLLAGYPWFKVRARDEFVAMFASTWLIGRPDDFFRMTDTAIQEIKGFIRDGKHDFVLKELDDPDVLLWFIRAIQQYAERTSFKEAADRYIDIIIEILQFIRQNKHPKLSLHNNGLLHVDGTEQAATWMNAKENDRPITARTGYVVEINSLWYNALKFTTKLLREQGDEHNATLLDYQAETTCSSFIQVFWNGTYLHDYVNGNYADQEVRPNMIFAAALPFSPLDLKQKKLVLDITTKELLTPKGLRTLSPKSGSYRPVYIGGQLERDRNYHNGPVWTWTFGAFAEAYLKIYKQSGKSFIDRILSGLEKEMSELCVGTLSELFDGNPPFKGHGGMSFAMNVAEIVRVLDMLNEPENEIKR